VKSKITQHSVTYWLKHNRRYLLLFPFVVGALLLALVSLRVANNLSPSYAILFAIFIVGILAAGGIVMNIFRDPRKRKGTDRSQHKRGVESSDALCTVTDDGEIIEVVEEKAKRKAEH
jgi:hypothetical protein